MNLNDGWDVDGNGTATNPFADRTLFFFQVPGPGRVTVEITVHDAAGRLVRRLVSGAREPGTHMVARDGLDGRGVAAPCGLYFVRLGAPGGEHRQKVLRLQ